MHLTRNSCYRALLALPLLLGAAAQADQIRLQYQFDRPELTQVKLGDEAFTRVTLPDCTNGGLAGQPALPSCGANVLLPFGHVAASVQVVAGPPELLAADVLLEPVQRPVPLRDILGPHAPTQPDATIYASGRPFPVTQAEVIGAHAFRGYGILTLKLKPVQYVPAGGELYYFPSLEVIVETEPSDDAAALYRGLAEDREAVERKVDNPQVARGYPAAEPLRDAYDLLIITTSQLAASFEPLKTYHDANGVATQIRTTTDIGSTSPPLIRDYIRTQYQTSGVSYVLIGADDDIIPAQDLYVQAYSGGDTVSDMPGDIFYGCLDGTWNNDGDGRYGEPNDGPGGADVDLVAEVYVGRAAVGNATEAQRFVNKSLWYMQGQHSFPERVLLVGEYLGFGGDSDYAANTLEELVDGCSTHGYTTTGIPSDVYEIEEMFERDMNWTKTDLKNAINAGLHLLNHLGHGSPDYAMKFYNSDVLSLLTNDELCFVYSQTCLAGHFDGTDCWAETINIKTDAGAFAVIMNARYGWGQWNSTDGPSQRFNRELWDAVFDEGFAAYSEANQDSKEDNIYRINEECMRWCTYELNLFGDPAMQVRGVSVTGIKVRPGDPFLAEGQAGGPFTPAAAEYTIENRNGAPVQYEVTCDVPWLTIANGSGTIFAGQTITVTVSLNSLANTYGNGTYIGTIDFANLTDHDGDCSRPATLVVGVPVPIYTWDLSTNPGWSTEGLWAWGDPTGQGGEYGGPDPNTGYTGPNVYGYNLNGDYENYLPERHLTTGAIDCTDLTQVHLRFMRWLGVEQPLYDHAYVRVSTNGTTWTDVWQNEAEITDGSWQEMEIDISALADYQPTVYIRWTMGTTDVGWRYCGWNIDDVQILGVEPGPPPCPEDLTGDGHVGQDDLGELLGAYGQNDGGDIDGDGDTDQADLGALLGMYGEDCP